MKPGFKDWLAAQNYRPSVVASRWANCQRVEQHYGDLDRAYGSDRLASIRAALAYSTEDQRRDTPNPSRILINGNLREGLATLWQAVGLYVNFRDSQGASSPARTAMLPMPRGPGVGNSKATIDGSDILRRATAELGIDLPRLVAKSAIWTPRRSSWSAGSSIRMPRGFLNIAEARKGKPGAP